MKYIQTDLFNTTAPLIAHGTNTVGGFSSGVAGQISKRMPEVKLAYLNAHKQGRLVLGEIQVVKLPQRYGKIHTVVNLMTQASYGRAGTGQHVNYDAVESAFDLLLKYCIENAIERVAIPKIGSGLGNGDWTVIEDRIMTVVQKNGNAVVQIDVHSL